MEKVVSIYKLGEEPAPELEWLDKTPQERLNALTGLRKRWITLNSKGADGERLQRVFRTLTRSRR
jgi:hypothetical protein